VQSRPRRTEPVVVLFICRQFELVRRSTRQREVLAGVHEPSLAHRRQAPIIHRPDRSRLLIEDPAERPVETPYLRLSADRDHVLVGPLCAARTHHRQLRGRIVKLGAHVAQQVVVATVPGIHTDRRPKVLHAQV
jgi:hypothetical protein